MKNRILIILFALLFFATYAYAATFSGTGLGPIPSGAGDWNDLTNIPVGFADGVDDESPIGAWGSSVEKTLASDIATLVGQGYYSIDTEGDAVSDDCTKFLGLSDGDEIIIRPESGDRTVVIKNGAFCSLASGKDFIMNNMYDRIRLQCIGADTCVEIARSNGGD